MWGPFWITLIHTKILIHTLGPDQLIDPDNIILIILFLFFVCTGLLLDVILCDTMFVIIKKERCIISARFSSLNTT